MGALGQFSGSGYSQMLQKSRHSVEKHYFFFPFPPKMPCGNKGKRSVTDIFMFLHYEYFTRSSLIWGERG